MIGSISRFRALPPGRKRALAAAFAALVQSRVRLRLQSVERVRIWARCETFGDGAVDDLVWALNKVLRLLPASTCLCRALALQRLLSAHGHASTLHIGVARPNGAFSAHAWLVHEARILIGGEQAGEHEKLLAWAAGQAMAPEQAAERPSHGAPPRPPQTRRSRNV